MTFEEEAIKKATAKQPNETFDGYFDCPECGHTVFPARPIITPYNYCPECGQKIDWRILDGNKRQN